MRLSALILLISLPALAGEFDWQEQMVKDGISVDTRKVPESKYREFCATVKLQAAAAHAVALLQDNAACSKWVYRCENSEVIEAVSTTERYFHQVTSLPFPARSRDAIFHGVIRYDADQAITITLSSAHDKLPAKQHVRITKARGFYHIEPVDTETISLTWQFYVDPAGALPAFLVNSMVTDLPFKSLSAFRDLVRQPPYNRAFFVYDESGVPVNIGFTRDNLPGDS